MIGKMISWTLVLAIFIAIAAIVTQGLMAQQAGPPDQQRRQLRDPGVGRSGAETQPAGTRPARGPTRGQARPAAEMRQRQMQNMRDLESAEENIDAAMNALENNNTQQAMTQLREAKELVAGVRANMAQAPRAGAQRPMNQRCPITGMKLPDDEPEGQTRQFKGQTVGFCCPNCPAKWDKLSDEEKQQKLDAAMKPSNGQAQPQNQKP